MSIIGTSQHGQQITGVSAGDIRSDLRVFLGADYPQQRLVAAEALFKYAQRVLPASVYPVFLSRLAALNLPRTPARLAAQDRLGRNYQSIRALIFGLAPAVTAATLGEFAHVRTASLPGVSALSVSGSASVNTMTVTQFVNLGTSGVVLAIRGNLTITSPMIPANADAPRFYYERGLLRYVETGVGSGLVFPAQGTVSDGVVRHGGRTYLKSGAFNNVLYTVNGSGIGFDASTFAVMTSDYTTVRARQASPQIVFIRARTDKDVLQNDLLRDAVGYATAVFLHKSGAVRVIKANQANVNPANNEREMTWLGGHPDYDTGFVDLTMHLRGGSLKPTYFFEKNIQVAEPGVQLGIVKHAIWVKVGGFDSEGFISPAALVFQNNVAGNPSAGIQLITQDQGSGVARLGLLLGTRFATLFSEQQQVSVRVMLWMRGTVS